MSMLHLTILSSGKLKAETYDLQTPLYFQGSLAGLIVGCVVLSNCCSAAIILLKAIYSDCGFWY